jgi:hypothetical protein
LLGPILYLLYLTDLPLSLELRKSDGDSAYADDLCLWVVADSLDKAQVVELQRLATAMANFTKNNGLALNGSKTQLLIAGSADVGSYKIKVDGARIRLSNLLKLPGVLFDRKLTVKLNALKLAKEAHFRAAGVARLAHHVPRVRLLRQLGSGLLMEKLTHALPIVVVPRLQGLTAVASEPFA